MTITRHFIDVPTRAGGTRRVHYRRAGVGPPLLLIHQSPRSGAEFGGLMAHWAGDFTCLAPDTPGFGESAAFDRSDPHVDDYADAVVAFMDALGLDRAGAYGVHSGAITLVTAARRAPQRFTAIAANGLALWTDAERADFGANYTPAFVPSAYGEHLTWAWHRIREQSWFFPWYAADDAHRLGGAHDDAGVIHAAVMDVMAAGRSYAPGYAAMLKAPRDLPAPGTQTPPVLLLGRDGDPLQAHIDRIAALPAGWQAAKLATGAEIEAAARDWLLAHAVAAVALPRAPDSQGYVDVPGFGQLHWRGDRAAGTVVLHAPGSAAEFVAHPGTLALDLPGHGLSDAFAAAPARLDAYAEVLAHGLKRLVTAPVRHVEGAGASAAIAARLAVRLGLAAVPAPAPPLHWPDLGPDFAGSHLARAWAMARAEAAFDPWYAPSAATARPLAPGGLDPDRLHRRVLAALRVRHMAELIVLLKGH